MGEEIAARRIDETAMKTPANIDLIEDGAYQAVRALTDERKRFLARAVAQGIQAEEKEFGKVMATSKGPYSRNFFAACSKI